MISAPHNELAGQSTRSDAEDIKLSKKSFTKVKVISRSERGLSSRSSSCKRKTLLEVGERVMLYGLNLTSLNGKIGTIVKSCDKEGRYLVQTQSNKSARAQCHNMILQGGPKFRSYASFLKNLKIRGGSIILPSGTSVLYGTHTGLLRNILRKGILCKDIKRGGDKSGLLISSNNSISAYAEAFQCFFKELKRVKMPQFESL